MISVSDALNEIISTQPFIEEGLARGLINYSAYAREVKPMFEKRLYKDLTEGSIVMALKRISEKLNKKPKKENSLNLTNLTVRSNLTEFTYLYSESLPNKQKELFNHLSEEKDVYCAVSQGIRETTFIASPEATLAIERIFSSANLIAKIEDLSSVSIHLPKEVVYIPGVYYSVLKMLAWENINVIEVLSTYTELTIILETKDVDKAFSILKNIS
ncbi:ACT domain-containing protein [Candidatus Daviesbacteria bacterium]|nr:ACT domain-containing protein [Candidatus Daviesbacteria bacterium]